VFYNNLGGLLDGVLVNMSLLNGSAFALVEQGVSDISGNAFFGYVAGSYYRFCYSKSGFSSGCFDLNPIVSSSYDVYMSVYSAPLLYLPVNVSGVVSWDNVSRNLTFSYVSYDVSYSNYSYTVSRIVNGRAVVLCSASNGLSYGSFVCDLSDYHGTVFVQGVADNHDVFFGEWVFLGGGVGLWEFVDSKDAAFISGLILAVMLFAGLGFGLGGILIYSVIALFLLHVLTLLSVLTVLLVVIDAVVCVVLVLILRS
jgi:hypothetical protein